MAFPRPPLASYGPWWAPRSSEIPESPTPLSSTCSAQEQAEHVRMVPLGGVFITQQPRLLLYPVAAWKKVLTLILLTPVARIPCGTLQLSRSWVINTHTLFFFFLLSTSFSKTIFLLYFHITMRWSVLPADVGWGHRCVLDLRDSSHTQDILSGLLVRDRNPDHQLWTPGTYTS